MPQKTPPPVPITANLIAIGMLVLLAALVLGIGSGHLQYETGVFNLIFGVITGAATTVLAFFFGSSKHSEQQTQQAMQATELAAATALAPPPAVTPGPPAAPTTATVTAPEQERLNAMLRHLAEQAPGEERDRLQADIDALRKRMEGGGS